MAVRPFAKGQSAAAEVQIDGQAQSLPSEIRNDSQGQSDKQTLRKLRSRSNLVTSAEHHPRDAHVLPDLPPNRFMTWCAGIWSDLQVPYQDPRAFSVAVQIFADAKLDLLIDNGDWGDYMGLATHPRGSRLDLVDSFRSEVEAQRRLLSESHTAIKPKKRKFNAGNHEWRVQRAFQRSPELAQMVLQIDFARVEVSSIREACSIPVILEFQKYGIQYSGDYPKGCWLKDGLEPEHNVYVHHGYTARKNSGYTVSGQMADHWSSQIIGHCERLAGPIWHRRLGRDYFGIESGNLSLIGEPDKGDDIYAGVPHSDPKLLCHRQGVSIVYYDSGQWWPFTIKIRDGRAFWNGRLYKA